MSNRKNIISNRAEILKKLRKLEKRNDPYRKRTSWILHVRTAIGSSVSSEISSQYDIENLD